mgnify:CR=1 FL=1
MKQKWKVFLSLICALVMSCSILAACDNGGETQSEVTVTLSEETLTLDLYEPATLEATVTGTDEDPVWSSSNEAVATVSETGEIVGLSNGQATITATVGDVSDSCAVTVQSTGATPMITGLPTQVTMAVDDTRTLTPAAEYKGNALSLTYAYESSDAAVASVTSAGVITAEGRGTATVSVTASYYTFNLEEEIEVTVTDNVSIALDADSLSLNVNDTRQLEATITVNGEAYTSTEGIAWSSSDSDAVEVSAAGLVTAKAETQMPVTVTLTFTYEGQPFTADCTVSVARETVDLTDEAVTEIEIYADAEADTVTLPLSMIPSSYAVTAADVTSVRDTAYNAAIPFENDGGTLELVKFTGDSTVGNIYSGETTYEVGTAKYVFEVPVLMISKVLKTADDIDDMQQYCMYDPATVHSPADKQFYYVAYFTLGDDIDYGGKTIGDWASYDSIGQWSNGTQGFMGTFDGRNHTISNMAVDNNNNGFIGTLGMDGVMKNVAFLNAQLKRGQCAVAVGLLGGKLDNVIVHGTRLAASASWGNSGLLAMKMCNAAASISNVLVFYEDFDFSSAAYDGVIIGSNDSGSAVSMTNAYAVCNTETEKLWVKDTNVNSFVAYGFTTIGELLASGEYVSDGFVGWDSTTSEKYGIALPATFDESSATDANFLYSVRITNTVLNAYPGDTDVNIINRTDAAVTFSIKETDIAGVTINASTGVITVDPETATNGQTFTVVASIGDGKYQSHEVQFTVANKLNLSGSLVIDLDLGVSDDAGIDAALFPESYPGFSFDDVKSVLNNDTQAAIEFEVSEGELFLKGLAAGEYSILVSTDAADFNLEVIVATMTIGSAADLIAFEGKLVGTTDAAPLGGYYLLTADVDLEKSDYVFGNVDNSVNRYFAGTFNGNGYAIKNMTTGDRGLFSNVTKAGVVKNLAFIDAYAQGKYDDNPVNIHTSNIIGEVFSGTLENVFVGGMVGGSETGGGYSGIVERFNGGSILRNVIVSVELTQGGQEWDYSSVIGIAFTSTVLENVVVVTSSEKVVSVGGAEPSNALNGITVYKSDIEAVTGTDLSAAGFDAAYWKKDAEGIWYGDELVLSVRVRVAKQTLVDLSAASDGTVALDLTNIKAVDSAFTAESVTDAYLYNGAEVGADIAHSASEGSLLLSGLTEGSYDIVLVTASAEYRVPVFVVTMVIDSEEDLIAFEDAIFASEGNDPVSGYYILGADIDLSESEHVFGGTVKGGNFAGTFDGQGYAIKGMTTGDRGLFNTIDADGVVKNVAFIDAYSNTHQVADANVPNGSKVIAHYSYGTLDNVFVSASVGWGPWDYSGIIGRNYGTISNSVFVAEARNDGTGNANWNTNGSVLGYVDSTARYSNVIIVTASTNIYRTGTAQVDGVPAGCTLYRSEQLASRDDLAAFSPDYWSKNADGETLFGDEVVVAGPNKVEVVSDKVIDLSAAAENMVALDIAAILEEDPDFDVNDIIGVTYYGGGTIEYSVSEGNLLLEDGIDSGVYKIVISTADTDYVVTVEVATMVIVNEADLIALETAINATTESAPLTGYYVLGADIVLNEESHVFGAVPATNQGYFAGIFDGKGYSITGMATGERGLFNNVSASGIVRNVAFIDAYGATLKETVNGETGLVSNNAAILCDEFRGTLENVFLSGTVGRGPWDFSGVVCRWQAATVRNSVFVIEQSTYEYTSPDVHTSAFGYVSPSSSLSNVTIITSSEHVYSSDYDAANQRPYAPNGATLYRDADKAVADEDFSFGSFSENATGDVLFGDAVVIEAKPTTVSEAAPVVITIDSAEQACTLDLSSVSGLTAANVVENGVSVTAPVSDVAIAYTGSESNLSLDMEDLLATGVGEKYIVVETADAYYRFALIIATQVISDLEDLQAFDALIAAATGDNAVTGYYVLGADIVVPEDSDFVMGNYTIGFSYWADLSGNIFNGIFDGMGYTISGLKVGDGGMFGNVIDGTIRNVSLVDIYAYGKGENSAVTINNGGSNILAQMMSGTVENVFVSGSAASQDGWYSGLVYDADGATFTNCVFDVELRGSLESWDAPMGLLRTNTYSNVVFLNDSGRVYTNHTGNAYSTSSPDATNFRVYADVAAAVAGEEFGFGSFTKDGSGNILFNGEVVVAAEVTE